MISRRFFLLLFLYFSICHLEWPLHLTILVTNKNKGETIRNKLFHPLPVSYTHLDVYKRQVYRLLVNMLMFLAWKNVFKFSRFLVTFTKILLEITRSLSEYNEIILMKNVKNWVYNIHVYICLLYTSSLYV